VNILVTGGCGFIGQHLVERLCSDLHVNSVWVLDSLEEVATGKMRVAEIAKLIPGDVCSPTDVNTAIVTAEAHGQPIDLVMHLAAQSHVDASLSDASSTMKVNAVGTQVVASACSYHKIPLLYCSTDEVYGPARVSIDGKAQEMFEEDILKPSSPYSAGKAAGELAVRAEGRSFGLRFAITRGCNAFGPYQYPEKLIPIACRLLTRGEQVPLHGGGTQIRQWIHVADFVECLWSVGKALVADTLSYDTYNIAGPRKLTVLQTVDALAEVAGWQLGNEYTPGFCVGDRPGQDEAYSISGERFLKEFGWLPERDILAPHELDSLVRAYMGEEKVVLASYSKLATA